MAKKRIVNLQFPMGGLDKARSYQSQPPYTTPDCENVRPMGTLERRARGGTRPGLDYAYYGRPNAGYAIRCMAQVTSSASDGYEYFSDNFDTPSIGAQWGEAAHLDPAPLPSLYQGKYATADPTDATGATLRQLANFDNGEAYTIELYIVPYEGDHHGRYTIFCRMDDVTPVATTDGVIAELVLESSSGAYSGTVKTYIGGDLQATHNMPGGTLGKVLPGVFSVVVSANNMKAYWRGTEIIDQALETPCAGVKGNRIGFGINCTQDDTAGSKAMVDWFRVQYYQTGTPTHLRTKSVVVAGGVPYQEATMGQLTAVANLGDITLPTDTLIMAAERGGVLYFADPTAIRTYTPSTDTLASIVSAEGTAPTGCTLIQRYLDRIVVAGDPASLGQWYMSRQGDPTDWDYAETDARAADSGTTAEAGKSGEPIRALAAWRDDYLLFGCTNSISVLIGDPMAGGRMANVSNVVGVLDKAAWCFGPDGEFIFLSGDGLYVMPPDGSEIKSVSREKLPTELLGIDTSAYTVLLAYDAEYRGVHIYLTAADQRKGRHWWVAWPEGTFWPVTIPNAQEPTAILQYRAHDPSQNAVFLGGRDGYVRQYRDDSYTDGGTAISSYIYYGPLRPGDDYHDGTLSELWAVLAEDSGSVYWRVHYGDTAEAALTGSYVSDSTFTAGANTRVHPRVRGSSLCVKLLSSGATKGWVVEGMGAVMTQGGKHRVE